MGICYLYQLITVIRHTLTCSEIILCVIIPIHITYSPTYSSVQADDMHRY